MNEAPPTEDKHYIFFEQFNPEVHKKDKMLALACQKDQPTKFGYSWVLQGVYKPLEKPAVSSSDDVTEST